MTKEIILKNYLYDIFKGSLIIFIYKLTGAILLFTIYLLISNLYGAYELGIFTLIISILSFLNIFTTMGLDIYIIKIIPNLKDEYQYSFLVNCFKITIILSISFIILFYFFSGYFAFKFFDNNINIVYYILLSLPFFTIITTFSEVFRAFNNMRYYSYYKNVQLYLFMIISFMIFYIFNFKNIYNIVFVSIGVSFIFFMKELLIYYKNNFSSKSKLSYKNKIIKYSYPMMLTSSAMFLMSNIDIFMISYMLGNKEVGKYSVLIRIGFILTFILTVLNSYIAPQISKAYHQNNFKKLKNIYSTFVKIVLITVLPIFMIIVIYPSYILSLFGPDFHGVEKELIVLMIGYLANALFGPIGYYLNMTDNQKVFMKLVFIALFINIILNLLLIPRINLLGAAISSTISMFFWNFIGFIFLKKKCLI